MSGSILHQAVKTYREDGMRTTVERSINHVSRNEPLGMIDMFNYLKDWWRMSGIKYNAYLRQEGWVESAARGAPTTRNGDPIPWYTYPAIDFLDRNLNSNVSVFEYGSGFSTLWYADRVNDVVGVEHDPEWVEIVGEKLPKNGDIVARMEKSDYVEEISSHAPVDIAVIDGEYRPDCVQPAVESLSSEGVLVLDDYHLLVSDRDYHHDKSEYQELFDSDFHVLPFYGPKAQCDDKRCTALFYRPENCLGI